MVTIPLISNARVCLSGDGEGVSHVADVLLSVPMDIAFVSVQYVSVINDHNSLSFHIQAAINNFRYLWCKSCLLFAFSCGSRFASA